MRIKCIYSVKVLIRWYYYYSISSFPLIQLLVAVVLDNAGLRAVSIFSEIVRSLVQISFFEKF